MFSFGENEAQLLAKVCHGHQGHSLGAQVCPGDSQGMAGESPSVIHVFNHGKFTEASITAAFGSTMIHGL